MHFSSPLCRRDRFDAVCKLANAKVMLLVMIFSLGVRPAERRTHAEEDGAATTRSVANTAPAEETWQAISLRGQRIGYGHSVRTRSQRNDAEVIVTSTHVHTVVKRFDGKVTLLLDNQIEEAVDGSLIAFQSRMNNPPNSRSETTGTIDGKTLTLRTLMNGATTESKVDVPAGVKSSHWVDRSLETQPLDANETREFQVFDAEFGKVMQLLATGKGTQSYTHPDGRTISARQTIVTYVGIPGLAIEVFQDKENSVVFTQSPLLQSAVWSVSQTEALAKIPEGVDIGMSALIQLTAPAEVARADQIKQLHSARTATYRLSVASGLKSSSISQGETQSVQQLSPTQVEVTVRSLRPGAKDLPMSKIPPKNRPDQTESKELESSLFISTNDPLIQKLARDAAPATATEAEVAVGCERFVNGWVNRKTMSTNLASASEVAKSKEGDCTEHAVLLAALLRARRIPSRVAVGLVYWDRYDSFAGHAWTEAWIDGHWIPLDATLAQGGIGCGHITLSTSTLSQGPQDFLLSTLAAWQLLNAGSAELTSVTWPD